MRKFFIFFALLICANAKAQVSLYGNFSFAKPIYGAARNTDYRALNLPFACGALYQIPNKKWAFGAEFGLFGLGSFRQNIGFANATTASDAIFWRISARYDLLKNSKKLIPYLNMSAGMAYFQTQINVENPMNTEEDLFVQDVFEDKSYMINNSIGVRWHLLDLAEGFHYSFWLDFQLSHTYISAISYINPLAQTGSTYTGTGALKEVIITNPQTNISQNIVVGRQYTSSWQYLATSLGVVFQF